MITSYKGDETDIQVPFTIGRSEAFEWCKQLESVVLPSKMYA